MRPVRNKLNIATAQKIAKDYCVSKNLSLKRLDDQKVADFGDSVVFAQPVSKTLMDLQMFGLVKDKETQPKPTLILRKTATGYTVEETEYTTMYLR